jgi:hypothetical protein
MERNGEIANCVGHWKAEWTTSAYSALRFLWNPEHLINHKHQLFTYLKILGIGVTSRDLYRFRS